MYFYRISLIFVATAIALLAGCASSAPTTSAPTNYSVPVQVTSTPTGATVKINNQVIGTTPFALNIGIHSEQIVTAGKNGYLEKNYRITSQQAHIKLEEDESLRLTTTHDAVNNWLRIQIDPRIKEGEVWQKLVDSATTRYVSLEQMDSVSGYLRSVSQVRRLRGQNGEVNIRTRFLCSISTRTPLVYKFRIESEISTANGPWYPFNRVFREDAALIEELQNRLGVK